MNYVVQLRKYHLLSHLKQKQSILLRGFFLIYLEIFQQNGKKSMYFLDEDVYGGYKEVSPEMQTICFPMLPPVIMDWNAAGKKKKTKLSDNIMSPSYMSVNRTRHI